MKANVPFDDVKQLFDENKQKSWSGLLSVLRQHKGKAEGIEDAIVDSLMMVTQRLDQSGQPYPGSAEQLKRVLDSEISKVTA